MGRAGSPRRGPRLLDADDARPLHRPTGAGPGDVDGGGGDDDAADRRARLRQRLQAPARAGQGAGDAWTCCPTAGSRSASAPDGWRADYARAGIPYDRPGVRIDRFEEALAVIKGAMARRAVLVRRRALHDHRLRRPARSRCSGRIRRSSSAAAGGGCCRSPPARPTSSASTARMAAGVVGPDGDRLDDPGGGRREGGDRAPGGRRAGGDDRAEHPRVHRPRHRRPRPARSRRSPDS